MSEEITTPEVDLDALLEAIKTGIKTALPTLQTVEDYFRLKDKVAVPAVGLEITGIDPDSNGDLGTDQFAAVVSFSAFCLVSYKTGTTGHKAKRRAASLAGAVSALIKVSTWGCPVQLAREINGTPDIHPHNFTEYECWRVDWKHACLLGTSVWQEIADSEIKAEEIFLGQAPLIGPGNEEFYQRIDKDALENLL